MLEQGHTYRFTATGEWVDGWNRCGPEGYASNNVFLRLLEWARRDLSEPWFALIGAQAHDLSTRFAIGAGSECQPRQTGELTCFANDVPFLYWNNRGEIALTIERLV